MILHFFIFAKVAMNINRIFMCVHALDNYEIQRIIYKIQRMNGIFLTLVYVQIVSPVKQY